MVRRFENIIIRCIALFIFSTNDPWLKHCKLYRIVIDEIQYYLILRQIKVDNILTPKPTMVIKVNEPTNQVH